MSSEPSIEAVASGAFHRDPLSRLFLILGAIGALVTMVAVVFILLDLHRNPWNPLGAYPPQQTNQQVYNTGGSVHTLAQKCSKKDGVMVRSDIGWIDLSQPGIRIQTSTGGSAIRYKSCGASPTTQEIRFLNVIPSAVNAIVKSNGPSVWVISGTDVPFRPDGRTGEPRTWSTNKFTIIP